MTAGYVMVPGWLLAKKPSGIAQSAYNHLAKRGTFHPGLGTYEECRPALSTLADDMGVNVKTARKAIQELEELGGIKGTPRYAEDGSQLPTVYRVIFGVLIEPTPPSQKVEGGGYQKTGGAPYQKTVDNQEPNTQNPTPTKNTPSPAAPDPFAAWWRLYPKKVGKAAGDKAYRKAHKAVGAQVLLDGLRRYVAWLGPDADHRFTAHPSTWLNEGRWADELPLKRDRGNGLVERGGMMLTRQNAEAWDLLQEMRLEEAVASVALDRDPHMQTHSLDDGRPW